MMAMGDGQKAYRVGRSRPHAGRRPPSDSGRRPGLLLAHSPGPAGHPGFATDGAKAFALGKPGADRYGDLKAIIRGPAALWVGHQSCRLTQRISRPFDASAAVA